MPHHITHIVFISFRAETPEEERREACERLKSLGDECGGPARGILSFKVSHNLDLRKNVHVVELAIFENTEALERFRKHPSHIATTQMMSEIADWQTGDIESDLIGA